MNSKTIWTIPTESPSVASTAYPKPPTILFGMEISDFNH